MRILLDEGLTPKLLRVLPGHDVMTVAFAGWAGQKNGQLLTTAEEAGVEVLLTGDKKLRHQHNFTRKHIAVVTLTANNWPIIRNHLAAIVAAIERATPGTLQVVECGKFSRKKPGGIGPARHR